MANRATRCGLAGSCNPWRATSRTPVSVARLAADVGGDGTAMKADTAAEYLDALERLMVVEHQPAWRPHLRSRASLRTTPIRHSRRSPRWRSPLWVHRQPPLVADLEFFGFLFESMVIRDLRVYAQASDAEVFHYREKDGLEVDAIVTTADGRWAAFEIKLGDRWVADGMKNLRRLAKRMENSDHGPPARPSRDSAKRIRPCRRCHGRRRDSRLCARAVSAGVGLADLALCRALTD